MLTVWSIRIELLKRGQVESLDGSNMIDLKRKDQDSERIFYDLISPSEVSSTSPSTI